MFNTFLTTICLFCGHTATITPGYCLNCGTPLAAKLLRDIPVTPELEDAEMEYADVA